MQGMVKVRFAPSPTGIPHVGNIRTALFDYFFAKANNGEFILRIEDTDQARKIEGAIEKIEDSLLWLGASWHEKVIQSERLSEYKKYAQQLVDAGQAREEDGAIRFITLKTGTTSWKDLVGDKTVTFENKDIEDFIILKKDGYPTYHLANVIDDYLMHVTHVIRGEDWIPSTPKHIMLYEALGWDHPEFAHVPNVLGIDGKKLSKRKGAKSVLDYKSEGILPEALLNYLMLLGWSPKNDREILSKEEIEKEFNFKNVHSAPAVFDEKKLLWMNGEYIRSLTNEQLKEKLIEFDSEIYSIENFEQYIPLAKTRMKTLSEFKELVNNNENFSLTPLQKELSQRLKDVYSNIKPWSSVNISGASISTMNEVGAKTKDLYTVIYGKPQGLPFAENLEIKGQPGTISWLEKITK